MNTSSVKEGKHSVTFRTKLLISQQTSTLSSTLQFRAWQETGPESNCIRTKGENGIFLLLLCLIICATGVEIGWVRKIGTEEEQFLPSISLPSTS